MLSGRNEIVDHPRDEPGQPEEEKQHEAGNGAVETPVGGGGAAHP